MASANASLRQQTLQRRARQALAGGVSSNTRLLNPHLIIERAAGCRMWDADGTEYLDYLLGQGPNFLGHAPPRVLERVLAAQRDGVTFAATHPLEIEAAERVLAVLGWAETMRFGSSSSEMVQAAVRIARAVTGRSGVMRFDGHYHGWLDNIYARNEGTDGRAGQQGPARVGAERRPHDRMERRRGVRARDRGSRRRARRRDHGAGDAERRGDRARARVPAGGAPGSAEQRGIVLIFDETITGFRVALGGAAERYGVHPDLAVYGKAMAAGWPCAALAGRRDLFADVASGAVTHAGTFNGNTIAAAAVLAST